MAKWADLMLLGEIWRVKCSRWRCNFGVSAEDLGLEDAKALEHVLSARFRLLPPEFFKGIDEAERKARHDLERASFRLEIAAGGLVPAGRGDALAKKLDAHKVAFDAAVMAAANNLDAARVAHAPALNKAIDEVTEPACAEAIRTKVALAYPTKDDFVDSFTLDFMRYKLADSSAKDAAQKGAKDVRDTIRTMVGDLRERVAEKVEALVKVAGGVKDEGGKIPTRSINAAVEVLDDVEAFNASLGDTVLAAQIKGLRSMLQSTAEGKTLLPTLEAAKTALQTGIDEAVIEAEDRLTGMGNRKVVKLAREGDGCPPVSASDGDGEPTPAPTPAPTPVQLPLLPSGPEPLTASAAPFDDALADSWSP